MTQKNKFEYTITQNDELWSAKIMRRVTKHKMTISKQKKGFESEALANTWAKKTLDSFIESLQTSNKRKAEKRQERGALLSQQQAEKKLLAIKYQEKQQALLGAMKSC